MPLIPLPFTAELWASSRLPPNSGPVAHTQNTRLSCEPRCIPMLRGPCGFRQSAQAQKNNEATCGGLGICQNKTGVNHENPPSPLTTYPNRNPTPVMGGCGGLRCVFGKKEGEKFSNEGRQRMQVEPLRWLTKAIKKAGRKLQQSGVL